MIGRPTPACERACISVLEEGSCNGRRCACSCGKVDWKRQEMYVQAAGLIKLKNKRREVMSLVLLGEK